MPFILIRICFIGTLVLSGLSVLAQKSIVISESLVANGEKLPVKTGNAWPWKISRFIFGEYAVATSRMGWGTSSYKSNLFGTKTQTRSSQKFSFVLTNKTNDSARVNAATNIITRETEPLELFPNVFFGQYNLLVDSNNFTALITLNQDTSETWALFVINVKSSVESKYEAFLTNRARTIFLVSTSSDKDVREERLLSAKGYEFIENERSLGAVQYFGGGMTGFNKKAIWMDKNLDAKMKLVLAAAMTAVMQCKQ